MTKFDPVLLELIETCSATEANKTLDVLVGLSKAADETELNRLREIGLDLRSTIGDIVTGSIKICDLSRLAASPLVIQIESSRPLYAESVAE